MEKKIGIPLNNIILYNTRFFCKGKGIDLISMNRELFTTPISHYQGTFLLTTTITIYTIQSFLNFKTKQSFNTLGMVK